MTTPPAVSRSDRLCAHGISHLPPPAHPRFTLSAKCRSVLRMCNCQDQTTAMGSLYLPAVEGKGGGHWFWTNATNCVRLPNPQSDPELCFGDGHAFSVDRGTVQLGSMTAQRWSAPGAPGHIMCAFASAARRDCCRLPDRFRCNTWRFIWRMATHGQIPRQPPSVT